MSSTLPKNPLPFPCFDGSESDQEAIQSSIACVVVGRLLGGDEGLNPPSRVRAVAATVAEWATKTGLPLAYVHLGTATNWDFEADDDDEERCTGLIGLVTALTTNTTAVDRAAVDGSFAASIPEGLWADLEAKHALEFGGENDDDGSVATFLALSGWTIARLFDGAATATEGATDDLPQGNRLTGTSADSTYCWKRLDDEVVGDGTSFWLHATYA